MSIEHPEATSAVVLFRVGERRGLAVVDSQDCHPYIVVPAIQAAYGPEAQLVEICPNLTPHQIQILCAISEQPDAPIMMTAADVRRALSLSMTPVPDPRAVREGLAKQLPAFLAQAKDRSRYRDQLSALLQLYVNLGDNPELFRRSAETVAAEMEAEERGACLALFWKFLSLDLPRTRSQYGKMN